MTHRLIILAALAAALSACGKQGPLERPAPLWGEARERYDAKRATETVADPAVDARSIGRSPLPGGPNDSLGPTPNVER